MVCLSIFTPSVDTMECSLISLRRDGLGVCQVIGNIVTELLDFSQLVATEQLRCMMRG